MKTILLLISGLLLAGCAIQSSYEQTLDDWVGHIEEELTSTWGTPHGTYEDGNGDTVYWYYSERTLTAPTAASSGEYSIGGTRSIKLTCNTWFWLDSDNRITRWQLQGNNCDESFVVNSLRPSLQPAPVDNSMGR